MESGRTTPWPYGEGISFKSRKEDAMVLYKKHLLMDGGIMVVDKLVEGIARRGMHAHLSLDYARYPQAGSVFAT